MNEQITMTPSDVDAMLAVNPLALEQVKVFALRRILAERDAQIRNLLAQAQPTTPASADRG